MKRLTTLLMTLMLMSTALWADETITVSANSSDISEGLDLKVVAKLFAEAKDLEQFEMMLNNPDSAFCNLDLNGDGQVDYLRVVETGEGRKRLIVLQAILAKDIYQDVASIYVEKDEADNVTVQIVGDEYIYGTNYIIEPVYVYRPVIYDWFWSPAWYAWYSPWYWGYYPGWWYVHSCWACDRYWAHCYAFHHCHYGCSFRTGRSVRRGYVEMQSDVTRRDYATANPDRSFSQRNSGLTNARELRRTSGAARTEAPATAQTRSSAAARTFDSRTTAVARTSGGSRNRPYFGNGSPRAVIHCTYIGFAHFCHSNEIVRYNPCIRFGYLSPLHRNSHCYENIQRNPHNRFYHSEHNPLVRNRNTQYSHDSAYGRLNNAYYCFFDSRFRHIDALDRNGPLQQFNLFRSNALQRLNLFWYDPLRWFYILRRRFC